MITIRADAARPSIVGKAQRSEAADAKAATKRADDGLAVHSFRSLLGDLATVTRNTMALNAQPDATFQLTESPRTSRRPRQLVAGKRNHLDCNPRVGTSTCVATKKQIPASRGVCGIGLIDDANAPTDLGLRGEASGRLARAPRGQGHVMLLVI